ncbi:hypothetical protein LPC08_13650 [Roseomonas sp. OT10]|uniref:hypothetical protein n=1 Tax=Roseomonas cutis TaxID=2897332 RepID=UPI001E447C30|nr:hypothetical protein [Roseomonas sp. OT10]UFN47072.1 hypothetical protein LPC08_13650 [Roseomonas sp. OT10]
MAIETLRANSSQDDDLPVAPEPPQVPKFVRPAYKPEEGPPSSELWGLARAVLYGALVIAFLAGLVFLWQG